MNDFILAIAFLLGTELMSLPLRGLLARGRMEPATRRVVSRVAGAPALALVVWMAGHLWGGALSGWWFWLALYAPLLGLAAWQAGSLGALLGYGGREGGFSRWGLDLLSLALFLGFVALRRHAPDMTAYPIDGSGAEKFTNAMLFWSAWHARELPPVDYWLAGEPLVYYYWGQFFWAWVGRMLAMPGELALNLGLARLTLLVFESAWLLGRALRLGAAWAAVGGVAAAWAGNPAALAPAWGLLRGSMPPRWGEYPYWDARGVIPGTVNEFPAFTAILGDFHAHHLALPWLIGWLALLLAWEWWRPRRRGWPATAALLGGWLGLGAGAALGNMWNLPAMAAVGLAALAWASLRGGRVFARLLAPLLALGAVVTLGILLMRAGAELPLAGGEGTASFPLQVLPARLQSSLPDLLRFWGLPLAALALAVLARSIGWRLRPPRPPRRPRARVALETDDRPHAPGLLAALGLGALGLAWLGWGPLLWAAAALWAGALALGPGRWISGRALWLLLGSCAALAGLELFYIDDAMSGDYERYNSYFKFSFIAWPPLMVGATAAAAGLWRARLPWAGRLAARLALVTIAAAGAVYPLLAFPARIAQTRAADEPPMPPTLDMTAFLAHRPPWSAETPLLEFIRREVPAGEIVAEAGGADPYSYGGRVASLAGRPVPLGWAHHQHQWRGGAGWPTVARHGGLLEVLYREEDPAAALAAARELGARWVIYGLPEEARYGQEARERLERIGRPAATSADGRLVIFALDAPTAPEETR